MGLPVNTIAAVVVAPCYSCGQTCAQCAECAVVLLIDPFDGLPIDVAQVGGRYVKKPVDASARARALQCLVCDECVVKARAKNSDHLGDTATERHDRGMCANARGR